MSNRIDNILIPDEDSECQSWKNYYKNLQEKYGTKNARESWLFTWNKKGNSSCTKSKEFNKWAESNEIAVADGLDKAVAGVSGIGQSIINGVGTLTGLTPKLAAVVLVSGVGLAIFLAFRIAKDVKPSDAMQMLPAGKVGSMLKGLK